jgi:hypothetical protein
MQIPVICKEQSVRLDSMGSKEESCLLEAGQEVVNEGVKQDG